MIVKNFADAVVDVEEDVDLEDFPEDGGGVTEEPTYIQVHLFGIILGVGLIHLVKQVASV
jgi:hypothetical protein